MTPSPTLALLARLDRDDDGFKPPSGCGPRLVGLTCRMPNLASLEPLLERLNWRVSESSWMVVFGNNVQIFASPSSATSLLCGRLHSFL